MLEEGMDGREGGKVYREERRWKGKEDREGEGRGGRLNREKVRGGVEGKEGRDGGEEGRMARL